MIPGLEHAFWFLWGFQCWIFHDFLWIPKFLPSKGSDCWPKFHNTGVSWWLLGGKWMFCPMAQRLFETSNCPVPITTLFDHLSDFKGTETAVWAFFVNPPVPMHKSLEMGHNVPNQLFHLVWLTDLRARIVSLFPIGLVVPLSMASRDEDVSHQKQLSLQLNLPHSDAVPVLPSQER